MTASFFPLFRYKIGLHNQLCSQFCASKSKKISAVKIITYLIYTVLLTWIKFLTLLLIQNRYDDSVLYLLESY